MAYSDEVYSYAERVLSRRRAEAEAAAQSRIDSAERSDGEIAVLRRRLKTTGVRIARAVLAGAGAKEKIEDIERENAEIKAELTDRLREIGMDIAELSPQYRCQNCKDTGTDENGKICGCMRALMTARACELLNEQSPLRLCGFEDFSLEYYSDAKDASGMSDRMRMSRNLEYCKRYSDGFSQNSGSILMYGATGLGKTHLSLAIAKRAAAKGYSVIYGSAQNLLSAVERERFSKDLPETTEETLLKTDLLVLDDLGAEFSSSFTVSVVNNIINTRLLYGRPTILSTNFSLDELRRAYPDRIVSRIICEYQPLYFVGRDIRQLKSREKRGR